MTTDLLHSPTKLAAVSVHGTVSNHEYDQQICHERFLTQVTDGPPRTISGHRTACVLAR